VWRQCEHFTSSARISPAADAYRSPRLSKQETAAGLLRVGLSRARVDHDLLLKHDAARAAGDGPRRLPVRVSRAL